MFNASLISHKKYLNSTEGPKKNSCKWNFNLSLQTYDNQSYQIFCLPIRNDEIIKENNIFDSLQALISKDKSWSYFNEHFETNLNGMGIKGNERVNGYVQMSCSRCMNFYSGRRCSLKESFPLNALMLLVEERKIVEAFICPIEPLLTRTIIPMDYKLPLNNGVKIVFKDKSFCLVDGENFKVRSYKRKRVSNDDPNEMVKKKLKVENTKECFMKLIENNQLYHQVFEIEQNKKSFEYPMNPYV